jgi:hypothetical protein
MSKKKSAAQKWKKLQKLKRQQWTAWAKNQRDRGRDLGGGK